MKAANYQSYFAGIIAAALVSLTAAQAFALTVCNTGAEGSALNNGYSNCSCGSRSTNSQTAGTITSKWGGFGNGYSNASITMFLTLQSVAPGQLWFQTWEGNTWKYVTALEASTPWAQPSRSFTYRSNTWTGSFRAVCAR